MQIFELMAVYMARPIYHKDIVAAVSGSLMLFTHRAVFGFSVSASGFDVAEP